MIKSLLVCCFVLLCYVPLYGQSGLSISGEVRDKKGETLPGAGVYLSGYKLATVTDNNGKFVLPNLKPGNYNILVEMMGYLPFTKNVILSDKSATVTLVLAENTITLKEVVIQADPNRDKYIALFKEYFIGKTPNATKCKLLNPQVLYIKFDKNSNTLNVQSNEFLIIENRALGYRLKYMLQEFEYNYNTRIIYYAGLPNFEELKGSKAKKKEWMANRELAYYGSSQQFFKALYKGTTKEEGFIIHKLIKIKNPSRPPDTLINKNIKRFMKSMHGVIRLGSAFNDSLTLWTQIRNMPKDIPTLNRGEVLTDTLVTQQYQNLKTLNYKDDLYVMYTKERETVDYTNRSGHSVMRPLDVPNYQISLIKMLKGPVHFFANGGTYEPQSLLYEGFWAWEKIADLVPMDYIPTR